MDGEGTQPLTLGEPIAADISVFGDSDTFSFDVAAGDVATITTWPARGSGAQPTVLLFGPGGSQVPLDASLGFCSDGLCVSDPVGITGTYTVVAWDFATDGTGSYTLGVFPDDEDGPAGSDNCPFYATAGPVPDTDFNGRGDDCECGDQSGDGFLTVDDLLAINAAIFNPPLVTPLCDANNDGSCDVSDILAVNADLFSARRTSVCSRYPVPLP